MNRSRSRSPLKNDKESEMSENEDQTDIIDSFVVKLENICRNWAIDKVKSFLNEIATSDTVLNQIKHVTNAKNDDGSECWLIKFPNSYYSNLALKEWTKLCKDKNIKVSLDTEDLYKRHMKSVRTESKRLKKNFQAQVRHNQHNSLTQNNHETYGLSLIYLESLGIKLPLGTRVYIANLDHKMNENKVRKIFSHAGHIVHVVILKNFGTDLKVSAKVEYDHPVEAVQAISMFNNQELFSRRLLVQMDNRQMREIPPGLTRVGPGLGPNGEPLRGVRAMLEIRALKEQIMSDANKTKGAVHNTSLPINPFQPDVVMNMNSAIPVVQPAPVIAPTALMPWNYMTAPPMANLVMPTNQDTANLQQAVNSLLQSTFAPNMPQNSIAQNMPQSTFAPNMPQNSIAQNMPQSTFAPNMPQSSIAQNMPQSTFAPNMPQSSIAQNMPQSSIAQNMPQSSIAQNMPQSSQTPNAQWQSTPPVNVMNNPPQTNSTRMDVRPNDYGNRNYGDDRRRNTDAGKHNDRGPMQGPSRDQDHSNPNKSDMLLFKNLPLSVSIKALTNKMKEVGDLKFAEMTGQGRAIVRFFNTRDAERCIKLFDKSKVDGQTIDVRFF